MALSYLRTVEQRILILKNEERMKYTFLETQRKIIFRIRWKMLSVKFYTSRADERV